VEGDETVVVDITGVTNGTESGAQQVTATISDVEAAEPTVPTTAAGVTAGLSIPGCSEISGARFVSAPFGASVQFPFGLLDFTASGCILAQLTITIQFSQAVPDGARFYKCDAGRCDAYPASIAGNTITYTVTDGGSGDADGLVNGAIVDPSGPGWPVAAVPTPVPTLPVWGAMFLTGLLILGAFLGLRRRFGAPMVHP
jgi:hypothetical protein